MKTAAKTKRKELLILITLGFVIAAFCGWVYEEICVRVKYGSFSHRGMLHIPLLPIYGFGAWGLAVLLRRVRSSAAFLLLSVLIASVFEYVCALLLELIFHETFWTYADWPLSFQNRISLISSLIFGLLALIFVKAVIPFVRFLMKKMPQPLLLTVSVFLILLISADFIFVLLLK